MSAGLRAWAAARGLEHQEVGPLLEPYTPVLRRGLGVGEHRASRVVSHTARSTTSTGGSKKFPERQTRERCAGRLPGGVDGVLAHQVHLERSSRVGGDGGEGWGAFTTTVVVVRLPERLRAVCELDSQPGSVGEPVRALGTVDFSGGRTGPLDVYIDVPRRVAERDGRVWRFTPAEDDGTIAAVDHPGVRAPLAAAPPDTRIEVNEGVLCVSAPNAVTDDRLLDALCQVAAAVAEGVRDAVARSPLLTAEAPVGPPPDTERVRCVDAGVATVSWPSPPPSVDHAVAAYGQAVAARATQAGRRVHRIALVALLVFAVVGFLGGIGFAVLFDDPLGFVIAVVSVFLGVRGAFRAAREVGGEARTDVLESRVRPWGIEAFARGYAESRGLVLEDPQELRHRLDSPVMGRPVRAWHGDLGEGVAGHLAFWTEVPPGAPVHHWLIAVVRAPDGESPTAPAPYVAACRGDLLVIGVQVAPADRSAAGLDALAAVARRLAAAAVAAA